MSRLSEEQTAIWTALLDDITKIPPSSSEPQYALQRIMRCMAVACYLKCNPEAEQRKLLLHLTDGYWGDNELLNSFVEVLGITLTITLKNEWGLPYYSVTAEPSQTDLHSEIENIANRHWKPAKTDVASDGNCMYYSLAYFLLTHLLTDLPVLNCRYNTNTVQQLQLELMACHPCYQSFVRDMELYFLDQLFPSDIINSNVIDIYQHIKKATDRLIPSQRSMPPQLSWHSMTPPSPYEITNATPANQVPPIDSDKEMRILTFIQNKFNEIRPDINIEYEEKGSRLIISVNSNQFAIYPHNDPMRIPNLPTTKWCFSTVLLSEPAALMEKIQRVISELEASPKRTYSNYLTAFFAAASGEAPSSTTLCAIPKPACPS